MGCAAAGLGSRHDAINVFGLFSVVLFHDVTIVALNLIRCPLGTLHKSVIEAAPQRKAIVTMNTSLSIAENPLQRSGALHLHLWSSN